MRLRTETQSEAGGAAMPAAFRDLIAVVAGLITRDGVLEDANRGFLELMRCTRPAADASDVRDLFVNPRFDQFAGRRSRASEPIVYRGILTLGDVNGARSLHGVIYDQGSRLWLVAEPDVPEIERLNQTVLELNTELAGRQRELVKIVAELRRQKVEAETRAERQRDDLLRFCNEFRQSLAAIVSYARGAVLRFKSEFGDRPEMQWALEQIASLATQAAVRIHQIKHPASASGPALETPRRDSADAFSPWVASLDARARQVLERLVVGRSNGAIAAELGMREEAVEVYRSQIMEKANANSLSDLIQRCFLNEVIL